MKCFVSNRTSRFGEDADSSAPKGGITVVCPQTSTFIVLFMTERSILDTISLALAVGALFEYVVADFGEIWLLLKMPL